MKTIIRNLKLHDVPDILILIPQWTEDVHISDVDISLSQNALRELTKSEITKGTLCLVAESNSRIVGVLTCQRGKQNSVSHTATLHIYFDPKVGNLDINKKLVNKSIVWASKIGTIKRIQTQIRYGNDLLIEMFKQLGFEVEATLRKSGRTGNVHIDSVVMAQIW